MSAEGKLFSATLMELQFLHDQFTCAVTIVQVTVNVVLKIVVS